MDFDFFGGKVRIGFFFFFWVKFFWFFLIFWKYILELVILLVRINVLELNFFFY